jgi:hypothetical protein
LRIGWFDTGGRALGATYDLQAAVFERRNVDPAWLDLGDDVGLIWSEGSATPILCDGCTPDNRLHFVVLDGETLSPKSAVLTLNNPGTAGGLTHPQIVSLGPELLVVADVEYHTSSEGMSATLQCEP